LLGLTIKTSPTLDPTTLLLVALSSMNSAEIELRFSASLRMMDFSRNGINVAVRFGNSRDTGLFSMPLA
jgi:hypothetical protein